MESSDQLSTGSVVRIAPRRGLAKLNLRELWGARELVWELALRDVRVQYAHTVLGVAWAVLVPLIQMVVFTLIVAMLFGFGSPEGIPFPLFNFAALVPWAYFSRSITRSTSSLVSRGNMIKKVYLQRPAIPLAAVAAGLVDFVIAFVLLVAMIGVFHFLGPVTLGQTAFPDFTWRPGPALLWLVPMMLLTVVTAAGFGLWASALTARYRDVGLVMPFVVQVWMYACPIIYSVQMLPESIRGVYALNPMVGVIEGFRWALLGVGGPPTMATGVSAVVSAAMLVGGLYFFRQTESTLADIL